MIENPTFLRDDPSPRLSNDPHSRLYMPPETVVPATWTVDHEFGRSEFEDTFPGGCDHISPIPIAEECDNFLFLLDDGFRYLFWFAISDKLAEITYPSKLEDLMETYTFHREKLKWKWVKDPLQH